MKELSESKFKDTMDKQSSNIGYKDIDFNILDRPIHMDKKDCIKEDAINNIDIGKNCPINNGKWDGERGNSNWYPDKDYAPPEIKGKTMANPDNLTMGQLMDKCSTDKGSVDKVQYVEGFPKFDSFSKGEVKLDKITESRSDNFDRADINLAEQKGCSPEEVAKWRKENNFTWHECEDMQTMQKVPNEIHANMPHRGGISEIKKEMRENYE